MNYYKGTPRGQLCLFEEKLDDIIVQNHLVRFIDLYIEKIDLAKLEITVNDKKKGRGYHPTLYLKIYIYSYLNKIRSSRKIENECKRNLELIWLTKQLAPDFWSISNFRKTNKNALKNIFKEFLNFCYKLELLSFDCAAIDGTKIRTQNSMSNVYKKEEIEKNIISIEKKIEKYITELESNDKKELDEYDFLSKNIPSKLKQLEKHKVKLDLIKEIFEENPELKRYFSNDPASNFQKDNGRCIVGYNCQTVVDERKKIIIATEVTNENNDLHQLTTMAQKINEIKKEFEIDKKTICVADAGYHNESEIMEAEKDDAIDLYVPHPKDAKTKEKQGRGKKGKLPTKEYEKEHFQFDKERNIFICPEGKILEQRRTGVLKHGVKKIRYQCKSCKECRAYNLCTSNKVGRTIEVSENYEKMKTFREKIQSELGKKIIEKRKELVEHPFGTIKRNFGFTFFMQSGIEEVKAEFNFIGFIYNFKRVINILGVETLIRTLNHV